MLVPRFTPVNQRCRSRLSSIKCGYVWEMIRMDGILTVTQM